MTALEPERVVSVYSPSGRKRGSGYLLSRDLVLTAAHVVDRGAQDIQVRALRRGKVGYELCPADLFSVEIDGALGGADGAPADFAVLRRNTSTSTVPDDQARAFGPPRLGKVTGDRSVPAEALCFPRMSIDQDGTINLEHVRGEVPPLTGARGLLLSFQVLSGLPVGQVGAQSLWKGASGSALFSGEHLIGILVAGAPRIGGRLHALSLSGLLAGGRHPGLSALVGDELYDLDATDQRSPLEPVWAGDDIIEAPYDRLPADWTAADLLQPRFAVVPFQRRQDTDGQDALERIVAWCETPRPGTGARIQLLTGDAATGKTRLAREACDAMRKRGWVAGLLSRRATDPSALLSLAESQLIVIDDADASVGELDALFARQPGSGNQHIRILAVSRGKSAWWDAIRRRYDTRVESESIDLAPSSDTDRLALYSDAVAAFQLAHDLLDVSQEEPEKTPGTGDEHGVDEEDGPHGANAEEAGDDAVAAGADLAHRDIPEPELTPEQIEEAVRAEKAYLADPDFESYLLVVIQALVDTRLQRQLDTDGLLGSPARSAAPSRTDQLYDFVLDLELRDCMASAARAGIQHDRVLLERVVAVASLAFAEGAVGGSGETAAAERLRLVPDLADEGQLLRRRIARWQHGRDAGIGYLRGLRPQRLAEHLVAGVIRDFPDLPMQLLDVTGGGPGVPNSDEGKAEQAANTLRLVTNAAYGGVAPPPSTPIPDEADPAMFGRSSSLVPGRAGQAEPPSTSRRDEFLATALQQALLQHGPGLLQLARRMSGGPTTHRGAAAGKSLVVALETALRIAPDPSLAVALFRGLDEDCPDILLGIATDIARQVVETHRQAADRTPRVRALEAEALKRLSHYLADSGHRRKAHQFAWDAVEQFKSLVRKPDGQGYRLQLAHALSNLAVRMYEIGNAEESVEFARDAVHIYEKLARTSPDRAHQVFLANGFCNLSQAAAYVGRWREGRHAAQAAYDLVREGLPAESAPDSSEKDAALAGSEGEDDPAMTSWIEHEDIAIQGAQAFSARTLARRLASAGERELAAERAEEACTIYAQLVELDSNRWTRDLAISRNVLGRRLGDLQDWDQSVARHEEAAVIFGGLEREYREAVRPHHADGLRDLAFSYLGRCKARLGIAPYAPLWALDEMRTGDQTMRALVKDDLERARARVSDALDHFRMMSDEDRWARRQRNAHTLRLGAEILILLELYGGAGQVDGVGGPVEFAQRALDVYVRVGDKSWQGRRKLAWARVTWADALASRTQGFDPVRVRAAYDEGLEALELLDEEEPRRVTAQLVGTRARLTMLESKTSTSSASLDEGGAG